MSTGPQPPSAYYQNTAAIGSLSCEASRGSYSLERMSDEKPCKPVERLFPFVLRSRILIPGREVLARSKGRLHFVLITEDLSENSRLEILKEFASYPVVQHYTSSDLEQYFGIKGAKVVGFAKSGLAQSIYAELKPHRLNSPPKPIQTTPPPSTDPGC